MKIQKIFARQILDSRGHPTIEVELTLENNTVVRSSDPSGASTGSREALELRDGGKDYAGFSVEKAIKNVNDIIAPALVGQSVLEQRTLDEKMLQLDGTENKSNLGANAILGVSMAITKGAAAASDKNLYEYLHETYRTNEGYMIPVPCMNMMNGGRHADNSSDFQEYMLVPFADKYSQALENSAEVFYALKSLLHEKGLTTLVGDEGGFAPQLNSNRAPLDIMCQAITNAGFKVGEDFGFALDIAATSFLNKNENGFFYNLKSENSYLDSKQLADYCAKLVSEYPIVSLEDGLSETDWEGWEYLYKILGDKVQIVGDDLFVTNPKIIEKGHELKVADAVLIKLNQIGTVTETINAINLTKSFGWNTMLSHRSGETEDTFIADFAVGMNTMQLKSGSLARSERVGKYNQLLRIEEALGQNAQYKGKDSFSIARRS